MKGEWFPPWRRSGLTLVVLTVVLPVVWGEVSPVVGAEAKPAGPFQIPAWAFDRGNAKVFANPDIYADYRDKHPELVAGDGGELTEKFSRSYESLFKKHLVSYLEGGFGSANVPAEPPLTFGSHQSRLVERIRKDPCKANLTREEFIRIVTWIDANAPYYGTHEGNKNLRWKDEPDFRPLPLAVRE